MINLRLCPCIGQGLFQIAGEKSPYRKVWPIAQSFLKEKYPTRYYEPILSCALWSYPADVNEQKKSCWVKSYTAKQKQAQTSSLKRWKLCLYLYFRGKMENRMVSVFYRQTRKHGGIQRGQEICGKVRYDDYICLFPVDPAPIPENENSLRLLKRPPV